jgi:hypothetical protein
MPRKGLLLRAALIGLAVFLAAGLVLPLGWAITHNRLGVLAGIVAAAVCLSAAWLALLAGEGLRKRRGLLAMVLVGMIIRMTIPLAAAFIVFFQRDPLADAGIVYYLILFYAVTLTVEVLVSLPGRGTHNKNDPQVMDSIG